MHDSSDVMEKTISTHQRRETLEQGDLEVVTQDSQQRLSNQCLQ